METTRVEQILGTFRHRAVLVVGDLILDRFVWGRVERISPEAPVPVVEVIRETVHLGGAANVAANLVILGCRPLLAGVIGDDEAGRCLLRELDRQGIDCSRIVVEKGRATTVKTRIVAQQQQVCRTDWESRMPLKEATLERLFEAAAEGVKEGDGVILSDYAKGVLDRRLLPRLIGEGSRLERFVAVDPKVEKFAFYRGAGIVTPNKKEAELAAGREIAGEQDLLWVGRRLVRMLDSSPVLITRGEEGMTLFEQGRHIHIPTVAREVFDVTGAGDTVISTLTLAKVAGASIQEAATLANHAAGVVVGKLGTAAANPDEIRKSVLRSVADTRSSLEPNPPRR